MGNVGRRITIERREKLAGSGIKYFVVLNLERSEFERNVGMRERSQFLSASKQFFPLANGETITIETMDAKNSFFVAAFPPDSSLLSQTIFVDDQNYDACYIVTLKLGLLKNRFIIEKI